MSTMSTSVVATGLDLSVRFGQQVRYQCGKHGCRRYFKVEDGHGTCGRCGTRYVQTLSGLFTAVAPEAVPA